MSKLILITLLGGVITIMAAFSNFFWNSTRSGESGYDENAKIIQQLLSAETNQPMDKKAQVKTAAPDFNRIKTPEIYLGYLRAEFQGTQDGTTRNAVKTAQTFQPPPAIEENRFYFVGTWLVDKEQVTLEQTPGSIIINYAANKINLAADKTADGKSVTAKILLDGKPIPTNKKGKDVHDDGTILIDSARSYNLVDSGQNYERHTVTIEFLQPKVKAFVFTFG